MVHSFTHRIDIPCYIGGVFILFAAVGVFQDTLQAGGDCANNRVRAGGKSHDHGRKQHKRGDHSSNKTESIDGKMQSPVRDSSAAKG